MIILIVILQFIILIKLFFGGIEMALSPEMQEFVDATQAFNSNAAASLANISADVQRLLSGASGMSQEDKDALKSVTSQLNALSQSLADQAAVVPE